MKSPISGEARTMSVGWVFSCSQVMASASSRYRYRRESCWAAPAMEAMRTKRLEGMVRTMKAPKIRVFLAGKNLGRT
jgi:hypothetical protein